jgi:hypothetical protein
MFRPVARSIPHSGGLSCACVKARKEVPSGMARTSSEHLIQDQGCHRGEHEYDQDIYNSDGDQSAALPAGQLLLEAALEFAEFVGLSHAASLTITARDLWHRYHRSESPLFRLA